MRENSSSPADALETTVMRMARMRRSLGLLISSTGARQLSRTCTQHNESAVTPAADESRCWKQRPTRVQLRRSPSSTTKRLSCS